MNRRWFVVFGSALVAVIAVVAALRAGGFGNSVAVSAKVAPSLEDRLPDGSPFNPSTQSFLRGKHWLESVTALEIRADSNLKADLRLKGGSGEDAFEVRDLPLDQLVPRLHYTPAVPPDSFDAFNLMMAEFSRNGLSVPQGVAKERAARFVTTLDAEAPWTLKGDYEFEPNPRTRPMRFSVVNNCLQAGLWELSAVDRAGEVYHAWFDFPESDYVRLVARTNGLPIDFAAQSLQWNTDPAPMALDRLRKPLDELGDVTVDLHRAVPEAAGYSTQDSRQKVSKEYARVASGDGLRGVKSLAELTSGPVHMRDFVVPGKYSLENDKSFDLRFLAGVQGGTVRRVEPKTSYRFNKGKSAASQLETEYLEIVLHLAEYDIVIGNLPVSLLVPHEEFALNGFGVGILEPAGFSERRRILLERGPAPSYAYLAKREADKLLAINSHDVGIEQIFIRAHAWDATPWWEITIGSFERIVDVIKYRVEMPESLHAEARRIADTYIPPLYLTYRDDNLR